MLDNHFIESEKTWDTIAESFDLTRRKPWRQCIDFIKGLPESGIVADLGCGNGRHLIPCAEHCNKVIGVDISRNLLRIAQNKSKQKSLGNVEFIHGNLVEIPLRDSFLDAVLYIASLHNIKGRFERLKSLSEVRRILKNNGKALITVWSRWQDKYRMQFLKKVFFNREELGDIEIYWRQHNLNIPRFYHLYSKKEFARDLEQASLEIIHIESVKMHSTTKADNYFAVVRKQ